MKTINALLLAGLVLFTVNARADYALSTTAGSHNTIGTALTTINTASGTTVFNISVLGNSGYYAGSLFSLYEVDSSGNQLSDNLAGLYTASQSGLGFHQALNNGTAYHSTVSWTLGSGLVSGWYALGLTVNQSASAGGLTQASGTGFTYFYIQPTAVPEPSQVVAGGMLLGCGALVFTGRRWMKKSAQ